MTEVQLNGKTINRIGETEVTTNKEEVSVNVKAPKIDLVIDAGCDYIIELMKCPGSSDMAISVAENIKAMAELLRVRENDRTREALNKNLKKLQELLPEKKGDVL